VRPEAIAVMGEVGLDISRQVPKRLDQALGPDVALVVGLCAEEICPVVPGARSLHWPLADPRPGDLDHHREIRDEVRERVKQLVAGLQPEGRSDGVQ
jgi:protein-tyrosine-phosphatase